MNRRKESEEKDFISAFVHVDDVDNERDFRNGWQYAGNQGGI